MKKIAIIPKVIQTYNNQFELSVEEDLIVFLKNTLKIKNFEILLDKKKIKKYDIFISSGGNNILKYSNKYNDNLRNQNEKKILDHCLRNNKKYLGLCYGAQFLANYFDGKFKKKKIIKKKNFKVKIVKSLHNLKKNELISVNSFKNYIIEDTPKNLIHYAINRKNKSIEIFKHYNKEIYGFMWHPERLQKLDKKIVNLFKKILCN